MKSLHYITLPLISISPLPVSIKMGEVCAWNIVKHPAYRALPPPSILRPRNVRVNVSTAALASDNTSAAEVNYIYQVVTRTLVSRHRLYDKSCKMLNSIIIKCQLSLTIE